METHLVREHLTGPVPSIRVPFTEDGAVDYTGLQSIIDFNIDAGGNTMLLTAGDSHFYCLSEDEIREVTEATVEYTSDRAMVVAADYQFATDRAVDFAKYAGRVGADVVMCLPPDWGNSCTPESLARHYASVAEHMPVMIVTNIFGSHSNEFGLETIERTLERTDNVVAIKDDLGGEFARKLSLRFHDECAIIAGGQKQNHMNMHPYGCDGYLSAFLTFSPDITHRYWGAIEDNDLEAAREVIHDYDIPLFDVLTSLTGGFDGGFHGIMELFGLAERYRRPPYHSMTDDELESLAGFLEEKNLL